MVASIYSEMLQYQEVGGNMMERLGKMNVAHLFVRIAAKYKEDGEAFNKVLFYILHTYSLKSKFHVLGADWNETKEAIARHLAIDESNLLWDDTVLLKSSEVISSIQNYLNYQGNRNFKHLCMLKDLYEQMVSSAVDNIKKASDETDYDQKYKNHDYASKLLAEINEWEQRVAEGHKELKDAMGEMAQFKKTNKLSLRMEDNINI